VASRACLGGADLKEQGAVKFRYQMALSPEIYNRRWYKFELMEETMKRYSYRRRGVGKMLPHVAIVTLTATVHAKGSESRIDLTLLRAKGGEKVKEAR